MKRQLKELIKYSVVSKDSISAKVKDFLFDKETWMIRYIEADFERPFSQKRILIPRNFIKNYYLVHEQIFIELTKKEIESCPRPENDLPISRKYEEELNNHYKIENYWSYTPAFTKGAGTISNIMEDALEISDKDLKTSLYSYNEVKKYNIQGIDGSLGHLEDLIVDDDWKILYCVVDTSNWLPWSKSVLIEPRLIEELDFRKNKIRIHLQTEILKEAPDFEPSELENLEYENNLHSYYDKSLLQL